MTSSRAVKLDDELYERLKSLRKNVSTLTTLVNEKSYYRVHPFLGKQVSDMNILELRDMAIPCYPQQFPPLSPEYVSKKE